MRDLHGEAADIIELQPTAVQTPPASAPMVEWQVQRRARAAPERVIFRPDQRRNVAGLERFWRLWCWGICGMVGVTAGVIFAVIVSTFIK